MARRADPPALTPAAADGDLGRLGATWTVAASGRYNRVMIRAGLHRRLIALAAAYALALQALIAVAAVTAPSLGAVLCSSDHRSPGQGGRDAPAPAHELACAFCPFAGPDAAPLPEAVAIAVRFDPAPAARAAWRAAAPAIRVVLRAGLARAPPA
jgi:hypothetical protein